MFLQMEAISKRAGLCDINDDDLRSSGPLLRSTELLAKENSGSQVAVVINKRPSVG